MPAMGVHIRSVPSVDQGGATPGPADRAPAALAGLFAVAAFCMPLATGFVTTSFSLLAIAACVFHASRWRALRGLMLDNVGVLVLALVGWAALRTLNAQVEFGDAIAALLGWHPLIFLPVLAAVPLAASQRRRAMLAFIAGNALAAGLAFGKFFGMVSITSPPPNMYVPPQGPIAGGWMMALAVFLCLVSARGSGPSTRRALSLAAALILGVLLFLIAGRTAYLALALLAILAVPWIPARRLVALVVALIVCATLAWQLSPVMRERVLETFNPVQETSEPTSTSIRWELYRKSLSVIADAPLLGHGLGSFESIYRTKASPGDSWTADVHNPHSEYLFLGVELGLCGVGLFVAMLAVFWRRTRSMDRESGAMASALVLTMAASSLFNSFLHDASPARAFVLLGALALGSAIHARGVRPG